MEHPKDQGLSLAVIGSAAMLSISRSLNEDYSRVMLPGRASGSFGSTDVVTREVHGRREMTDEQRQRI